MNKAYLFFYTLKHLKLIQLTSRLKRRLTSLDFKVTDSVKLNKATGNWKAVELLNSSHIESDIFRFLNHEGDVGSWNDDTQSKLWLYNLHYFDDLNAFNSLDRKSFHDQLISKWIDDNPPLVGNGWEPYPQSLRIVNWIKYFLAKGEHSQKVRESLFQQAYVLYQDLEYHLLGNHLFANAKALIFAGCYFEGDTAVRWLNKGLDILDKEIPEQILNDGANFELSPMYHHIILSDLLDLVNLAQTYSIDALRKRVEGWKDVIGKMITYAEGMIHPDGDVSFFNDSAKGIAPNYCELRSYALKMGIQLVKLNKEKSDNGYFLSHFKDAGYIVLESDKCKAILDLAKVGPDYIPGHAHADTLSFEASFYGQRVFVNSGTSEYGLSQERLRQRKTAAHNTVEVDRCDSSEVWSGFRVAKRAYPSKPVIAECSDFVRVSCSHNGFTRLPGKVVHSRSWELRENEIFIEDLLEGQYEEGNAHYHIHPDIKVSEGDSVVTLVLPRGEVVSIAATETIRVEDTTWHPEFGISLSNKKLIIPVVNGKVKVTLRF